MAGRPPGSPRSKPARSTFINAVSRYSPFTTAYRVSSASVAYAASLRPPPARSKSLTRIPRSSGYSPGTFTWPDYAHHGHRSVRQRLRLEVLNDRLDVLLAAVVEIEDVHRIARLQRQVVAPARVLPRVAQIGRNDVDRNVRRRLAANQDVAQVRRRLHELGRAQQIRKPHALKPMVKTRLKHVAFELARSPRAARDCAARESRRRRARRPAHRRPKDRRLRPLCRDSRPRARPLCRCGSRSH